MEPKSSERRERTEGGSPGAEPTMTVALDPLQFFDISWPGRPETPPDGGFDVPPHGQKTARSPGLSVALVPSREDTFTDVRHKTTRQPFRTDGRDVRRVLVARMNDVFVYVEGPNILITDTELEIRPHPWPARSSSEGEDPDR